MKAKMSINRIVNYFKDLKKQNEEMIYADIWHDTCRGIKWIQDLPSISPGRAAVGYNYLYVMTRILNELKPENVLEMGLGISSTLISQYFKYSKHGEHIILEHDKAWGEFYTSNHELSDFSIIEYQNIEVNRIGKHKYNSYSKGTISRALNGKKFSLISVDAPISDRNSQYSRRDILDLLPDVLEQSFVIVIDDAGRAGERRTIADLKGKLNELGIVFYDKIYRGESYVCVIASEDNKFFCSL